MTHPGQRGLLQEAHSRSQDLLGLGVDGLQVLICEVLTVPWASLDLATLTLDQRPTRFSASKRIKRGGQLDGVCMYFKATFDADISFCTGPDSPRTHWPMLLYRTPARGYDVGDSFNMQVEIPDLSDHLGWSWQIA